MAQINGNLKSAGFLSGYGCGRLRTSPGTVETSAACLEPTRGVDEPQSIATRIQEGSRPSSDRRNSLREMRSPIVSMSRKTLETSGYGPFCRPGMEQRSGKLLESQSLRSPSSFEPGSVEPNDE